MTLAIKDGGMVSTALQTQLIAGTEHIPFHNVLGSVGITNSPTVLITGGPAVVQFGLSSVVVGQQPMSASMPMVLASSHYPIPIAPGASEVLIAGFSAVRTLGAGIKYQDIPRGSAFTTLGSTGATGDYLDLVLCMVSTLFSGGPRVSLRDGTVGDTINLLPPSPGGGAGTYPIPFGYPSRQGGWQIATDSTVSVRASGIFT